MYKKILVPLDGSKGAESILPHVEAVALCFQAKLVLLHVVENSPNLVGPHGSIPDMQLELRKDKFEQARRYLAGLKGEFREKHLSAKTFVEEGPVVRKIIQIANQEDVDLIAMASHGRTGLAQVYYGSVTAGVLHQVDRPLMLIRTRDEFLKMKEVS